MKVIKCTLMMGMFASIGIKPLFNPRKPPIPATVVHVINVAKPNPEVGITNGRVMMSSRILLPGNSFLART